MTVNLFKGGNDLCGIPIGSDGTYSRYMFSIFDYDFQTNSESSPPEVIEKYKGKIYYLINYIPSNNVNNMTYIRSIGREIKFRTDQESSPINVFGYSDVWVPIREWIKIYVPESTNYIEYSFELRTYQPLSFTL